MDGITPPQRRRCELELGLEHLGGEEEEEEEQWSWKRVESLGEKFQGSETLERDVRKKEEEGTSLEEVQ